MLPFTLVIIPAEFYSLVGILTKRVAQEEKSCCLFKVKQHSVSVIQRIVITNIKHVFLSFFLFFFCSSYCLLSNLYSS